MSNIFSLYFFIEKKRKLWENWKKYGLKCLRPDFQSFTQRNSCVIENRNHPVIIFPRSLDSFFMVSYYVNWVMTSSIYSTNLLSRRHRVLYGLRRRRVLYGDRGVRARILVRRDREHPEPWSLYQMVTQNTLRKENRPLFKNELKIYGCCRSKQKS